ncbi:MAG: polyphosphate kinase 1 [Chloroflexi bacterium]|nr:polyphosphate kinase 1 [Chloroflexota bacterium]
MLVRTAVTSPPRTQDRAHPTGLDDPALYLNRELTWLNFNLRVIAEAEDERNPLLERVKFLAITASNIDEFFMKRIGGLKQQAAAGVPEPTVDGRTASQQIAECYAWVREFERQRFELECRLLSELAEHDIRLLSWHELNTRERADLRAYYEKNVFPLVTPLALDPAHPFPFISNLSLNLLVTGVPVGSPDPILARVKVPVGQDIPRLLRVGTKHHYIRLEELMVHTLDSLFPGLSITSCELFRVTRNANTERDEEEADDLLELIESEVRERRFAPMVRLELEPGMNPQHRSILSAQLGLNDTEDVFDTTGMLAVRDLMELVGIDIAALHDPPFHPIETPRLPPERNIFHSLRDAGSLLVVHPYESFAASVDRFLRDASTDPKVRAIKMTLYRTSRDARFVAHLEEAARNGKQVAVVVELKARFDEAANIAFAEQLQDAGIHVSYGVVGYKTHSKVLLVVRQDYDGLRRYVHLGTGNYHPDTARIYSDIGLFTTDQAIVQDVTELFNYLTTGYGPGRGYRKLLPGPVRLKSALLERIDRERRLGAQGLLRFKMNALEDADITAALYRAAQDGVRVELIVRDTCRLRPGLPGLSETVKVVSVVGRFLEHSRIYYFLNGGAEEYFIGSADCMKRNLEHRVEVLVPVDDPLSRETLKAILDLQVMPNRNTWQMQSDGSYVQTSADPADRGCQQALYEWLARRELSPKLLAARRRRRFGRRIARAHLVDGIA